jgi:hypothetical protein
MRHLAAEGLAGRLRERPEQRSVEQPRRDGDHPDGEGREVAGDRQCHADDAALGRGVRGLPDLPVERRDRRGVDDHAALFADQVERAHALSREADDIEGPDEVDLDEPLEVLKRKRTLFADGLERVAGAGAIDHDPQPAHLSGHVEGSGYRVGVTHVARGEPHGVAELFGDLLAG